MFLLLRVILLFSRGSRLLLYDYLIVGSSVCYMGEVSACSYASSSISTDGSRVHGPSVLTSDACFETSTIDWLETSSYLTCEILSSLEPEPSSE